MNILKKVRARIARQMTFSNGNQNHAQISTPINMEDYTLAYRHVVEKFEFNSTSQGGRMQLLGWDVEYVDGPALANFIDQLLIRRVNDFIPANDRPFILDCGANIGFSVLNYKRQFPKARVIAFEPDPQFAPILRRNLERNQAGDVQVVEAAVWIENSEMPWFSEGIDGSRLLDNQEIDNASLKVKTADLKGYLAEPVDLLKIDIEGAEYKVLDHIKNNLGNVKNIIVECHVDQNNLVEFSRTINVLTQAGFHVTINSMGVWRDLIRQRPVEKVHWEQYFVISAWRTPLLTPSIMDDTIIPFAGIHHLLKLKDFKESEEKLVSIIHTIMRQQEALSYTLKPPFWKQGNLGWVTAALPRVIPGGDNEHKRSEVTLLLFEDELLLGPSHSVHDEIRKFGKGRYSHWKSKLYFSSSDGSDPNKNGRTYKIIY